MIVANDAHVTYQVYASGKRVGTRDKLLSLDAIRGGRGLTSVPALRGVSFTASEGETIGVVGHNGSGKSTLFKAMSGLIPTSQGEIWARDRPVLLGVNAALVPELSGEDNIKLGLLAMGFSKTEAAAHVDDIADFAELNEFIHHPMRTYSSGMGARLRFAIASAKAHSILLVDEALAVGDRKFRTKSEERIRSLRDSAGLVMIVSHSVGSLKDSCERVLWIHKGELREDGPADGVIDDYVRWTKDPKSTAVGAAAHRPAAIPPAPDAPTPEGARDAAPVASGLAALEALFATSAHTYPDALPRAERGDSARTSARRERFRQAARARRRRRILAIAGTIAVLLLAVAAGAAIALLTQTPTPGAASAAGTTSTRELTTEVPTIESFAAADDAVQCESDEGSAGVSISWQVAAAERVALGRGSEEVDAFDDPIVADLEASGTDLVVPYPCDSASQTYSLTAQNAGGDRISARILVTRQLVEPEEESVRSPDEDTAVPPAAPAPSVPSPAVEPSQEPAPAVPAPQPTATEEPPAPEVTEPADPEPTIAPLPSELPLPLPPTVPPAPDPTVSPGPDAESAG